MGCAAAPAAKERVDEPARCAATPRAALDTSGNGASLDRTSIQRAFRRDVPRHRCCYQAHLARHPGARGRATITVTFAGARATDAVIKDAAPELELDAALSACLLETARRMDIPEWADAPASTPPSTPPPEPARPRPPGESAPEEPSPSPSTSDTFTVTYPLTFSQTEATP
jgi:hypothetical protein